MYIYAKILDLWYKSDVLGTSLLTGQSGAPLDSPVNYSHVAFSFSRERRVRRWRVGRGRGWLTGQSGDL
jgi:hypothetical protein